MNWAQKSEQWEKVALHFQKVQNCSQMALFKLFLGQRWFRKWNSLKSFFFEDFIILLCPFCTKVISFFLLWTKHKAQETLTQKCPFEWSSKKCCNWFLGQLGSQALTYLRRGTPLREQHVVLSIFGKWFATQIKQHNDILLKKVSAMPLCLLQNTFKWILLSKNKCTLVLKQFLLSTTYHFV